MGPRGRRRCVHPARGEAAASRGWLGLGPEASTGSRVVGRGGGRPGPGGSFDVSSRRCRGNRVYAGARGGTPTKYPPKSRPHHLSTRSGLWRGPGGPPQRLHLYGGYMKRAWASYKLAKFNKGSLLSSLVGYKCPTGRPLLGMLLPVDVSGTRRVADDFTQAVTSDSPKREDREGPLIHVQIRGDLLHPRSREEESDGVPSAWQSKQGYVLGMESFP
ncbi:uncharacterized protein LOC115302195 [Suricata suricatta]|uniref:uncharacterized protein LOC115302195 n=1 Tax=Suricata suricatta TaxID=37032 RepID=UPI0011556FC6|nr:uncharacterized protein LOC115302195 [Suricata suricatta]